MSLNSKSTAEQNDLRRGSCYLVELGKDSAKNQFFNEQNIEKNYRYRGKPKKNKGVDFTQFLNLLGQKKQITLSLQEYKNDLIELTIQKVKDVDYMQIIAMRQNSIRKLKDSTRHKKNWSKDDFIIMLWVIQKYNMLYDRTIEQYTETDWINVASYVPGKDDHQCMFKWLSLKRNRYTEKFPWTETEQNLLRSLVNQQNPKHWMEVAQQLYLQNPGFKIYRTPKHCRQRWACYLNPNLKKGLWESEQDIILLKKYLQMGKKWSNISKLLNGRTQNAVKNRFNLILQKKHKLKFKASDQEFIKWYIQNIELNIFVKDTIEANCDNNLFQETQININRNSPKKVKKIQKVEQKKYEKEDAEDMISNTSDLPQQQHQIIQERIATKLISFTKINLKKLLELATEMFPSLYNSTQGEIQYKEILPAAKRKIEDYNEQLLQDIGSNDIQATSTDIFSNEATCEDI